MKRYSRLTYCIAIGASIALSGCSSGFSSVAPTPPEHFTRLGKAEGSACGSLGILATAYNVVPMGINSRVSRAYDKALASVPGATGLVDVTMQENWFWWLVGTARCVTISGEAISGEAISGEAISGEAISGAAISGAAISGAANSGGAPSGPAVSGAASSGEASK